MYIKSTSIKGVTSTS